MAASMPRTLGGLCRGARPYRLLKVSIVSGVIRTDLVNFSPPWTTRWPTAEISFRSSSDADLGVEQGVDDELDGVLVVAALVVELDRLAAQAGLVDVALADADALDDAGGQGLFLGVVVEAVFDGRTAAVQGQDLHGFLLGFRSYLIKNPAVSPALTGRRPGAR